MRLGARDAEYVRCVCPLATLEYLKGYRYSPAVTPHATRSCTRPGQCVTRMHGEPCCSIGAGNYVSRLDLRIMAPVFYTREHTYRLR